MTVFAGILLLINANGAVIMQPLPDMPNTVCMGKLEDHTVRCWKTAAPIPNTPGYKTSTFTLNTTNRK